MYGFLELVAKTGRTETNANLGAANHDVKLWQETHQLLSTSMIERLEPYYKDVAVQPHQMRGSFEECRFSSRVLKRGRIDQDPARTTGLVTFNLGNTGITFKPGDRLAVMPLNSISEIEKVISALGLRDILHQEVPLQSHPEWKRFADHLFKVERETFSGTLSVYDVLRRGHLAPLTKSVVTAVNYSPQDAYFHLTPPDSPNASKVIGYRGESLSKRRMACSRFSWRPSSTRFDGGYSYAMGYSI